MLPIKKVFLAVCLLLFLVAGNVEAQFGIGKKKKAEAQAYTEDKIDLEDDPEMLAAMEIFAGMSPKEMEETMQELIGMLGDDPETLEAMKEVMDEIQKLTPSDIQSSLKEMITDDEISAATHDALKMLHKTDWETIWERKDEILDAVIQSGQITPGDAALFKSDDKAWEKELKFIFSELQKQASETDAAQPKGDEL